MGAVWTCYNPWCWLLELASRSSSWLTAVCCGAMGELCVRFPLFQGNGGRINELQSSFTASEPRRPQRHPGSPEWTGAISPGNGLYPQVRLLFAFWTLLLSPPGFTVLKGSVGLFVPVWPHPLTYWLYCTSHPKIAAPKGNSPKTEKPGLQLTFLIGKRIIRSVSDGVSAFKSSSWCGHGGFV